ncbi:hypothetical protein PMAYCL1PPCAC_13715, partial [Pristionchus mayeri]
ATVGISTLEAALAIYRSMKSKRVKFIKMDEEDEKELVIKKVRTLFAKVTPETEVENTKEFLHYHVHHVPSAMEEVVGIIFDQAIKLPIYCEVYTRMCVKQVKRELSLNDNVSNFSNAVVARGQEKLSSREDEDAVKEKQRWAEMEAEADEEKREQKHEAFLKAQDELRLRKFGKIMFIGHLHLHNLLSIRIIHTRMLDLLNSVKHMPEDLEDYVLDEDALECAVILLETIGQSLFERNAAAAASEVAADQKVRHPLPYFFPLDNTLATLEAAAPLVNDGLRERIQNLLKLSANDWIPERNGSEKKLLDENDNDDSDKFSYDDDQETEVLIEELKRTAEENAQLRSAVADMQTAMEAMRLAVEQTRKAMARLEEKNKMLLELARSTVN